MESTILTVRTSKQLIEDLSNFSRSYHGLNRNFIINRILTALLHKCSRDELYKLITTYPIERVSIQTDPLTLL